MPDKWPLANGNWSDAANWNGGTKPVLGDDVFADNRTVTIDEDINVASLRTTARSGGTAGGGFTCSSSRTITANITAGTTSCLTCSGIAGVTVAVIGNVTGSATTSNTQAVNVTGANNVTITGSVTGSLPTGVGTGYGVNNQSTGQVTIIGPVSGGGGGGGNQNDGIRNSSTGVISVVGSVTGGNGGSPGIRNQSTGTVNVTGNVVGGGNNNNVNYGILNNSTGLVNVVGNVTGGPASNGSVGIWSGGGRVTVTGTVTADGVPAMWTTTTTAVFVINGNLVSATNGMTPVVGQIVLIQSNGTLTHTYRVNNAGSPGVARSLFTGGQNLGQPTASDVRLGTVFGVSNEFTGTCAVPGAASVAVGVPVDNTVGTASITAANIRAAIGLGAANLDTQLSGISTKTNQLTFTVANQVDANSLTGGLTEAQVRSAVGMSNANLDAQLNTISTKTNQLTFTTPNQVDANSLTGGLSQAQVRSAVGLAAANLDSQLSAKPTLSQIEASTVIAKEATVSAIGILVTAISAGVSQLTSRVTTSVATMFTDLIQMIAGSGTVNAKWTSKALENGPSGTVSIPAEVAKSITKLGRLAIYRNASFSYQFTGLGDLSGWTKIYFTLRPSLIDDDSKSLIQIRLTNPDAGGDGLLVLNAATAGDATLASITVDSATLGNVTVRIKPSATQALAIASGISYDLKWIKSGGEIPLPAIGTADILTTVTKQVT